VGTAAAAAADLAGPSAGHAREMRLSRQVVDPERRAADPRRILTIPRWIAAANRPRVLCVRHFLLIIHVNCLSS
jgi:hypothetical protein